MNGPIFDHASERRPPPSTRAVATLFLALVLTGAAAWSLFGGGVAAGERSSRSAGPAAEQPTPLALARAAALGDGERLASFLAAGIDPNACDETGQSALLLALRAGETGIASRLLEAGACLSDARRTRGLELLLASSQDDALLIERLIAAGAAVDRLVTDMQGVTAMHVAAESGCEKSIGALIHAGAELDARDARGFSPLMCAALLSKTGALRYLIERGADVRVKDLRGRSALQLAAAVGNLDGLRNLMRAGADPRLGDDRGWTALHEAAAHGQTTVLRALIDELDALGMNARTSRGATALHLAARSGNSDCVRALLDAGASVEIRDADGRIARDMAPSDAGTDPWSRLGRPAAETGLRRPGSVMLDPAERRPVFVLCARPASAASTPGTILDLAIWEDGATVFCPWRTDGSRDYRAGVLPPSLVQSVLLDLEESGWLDTPAPPVDPTHRDCVELTLRRKNGWKRVTWDAIERPQTQLTPFSAAARVDWSLERSKAAYILRGAHPSTTHPISQVLVRGKFRGITLKDGPRAAWMESGE